MPYPTFGSIPTKSYFIVPNPDGVATVLYKRNDTTAVIPTGLVAGSHTQLNDGKQTVAASQEVQPVEKRFYDHWLVD